ncbi:MAG: nicotinate-nucleotide adenylyltransferase [Lachnospiraceae bacterium]|nr:nicotinate-nucleotide adenylyltransferase [Lachnospiraceae bacterium]
MVYRKKVGIMGGTFDPIHIGHLILAETARDYFQLDEILFIPSGNSYMKNKVTDKMIRSHMVALAIEGNPHFALSNIEVDRTGNTYSYETVRTLKEENPDTDYFFIVGADSIFSIETWKNVDMLLDDCIIAVAVRKGHSMDELENKINFLNEKYQSDIRVFNASRVDVSSTDIRERLETNHSTQYIIPDKVLSYILKNNIYDSKS